MPYEVPSGGGETNPNPCGDRGIANALDITATGRNLNCEILRRLNVPHAAEKCRTHSMVLANLSSNLVTA